MIKQIISLHTSLDSIMYQLTVSVWRNFSFYVYFLQHMYMAICKSGTCGYIDNCRIFIYKKKDVSFSFSVN